MSSGKVSISIVNFNRRNMLAECLASVQAQTYPDLEVVVVDNASQDGSAEMVEESFPGVSLIRSGSNLIFCKGQNTGIGSTGGDYVLVLNNDVVLDKDFVREAVGAMEADSRIGSVSGRILRKDGEKIDTTGLFLGRDRRPVERGYGLAEPDKFMEPGYVFGAGGACPLYRRAMLDEIKFEGQYFDEDYEAFYEDLDLAWRANRRGWLAWYTPRAVAYHHRGGTAKEERPGLFSSYDFAWLSNPMKARLLMNRWLTMIKNDSPLNFLINLPFILLYDIKIWLYVLLFSPGAVLFFWGRLKYVPAAFRHRRVIEGQ